jgi:hypothetical protein
MLDSDFVNLLIVSFFPSRERGAVPHCLASSELAALGALAPTILHRGFQPALSLQQAFDPRGRTRVPLNDVAPHPGLRFPSDGNEAKKQEKDRPLLPLKLNRENRDENRRTGKASARPRRDNTLWQRTRRVRPQMLRSYWSSVMRPNRPCDSSAIPAVK